MFLRLLLKSKSRTLTTNYVISITQIEVVKCSRKSLRPSMQHMKFLRTRKRRRDMMTFELENLTLRNRKTHQVGQTIKAVQATGDTRVKQMMVIRTIMTQINSRGSIKSLSKSLREMLRSLGIQISGRDKPKSSKRSLKKTIRVLTRARQTLILMISKEELSNLSKIPIEKLKITRVAIVTRGPNLLGQTRLNSKFQSL